MKKINHIDSIRNPIVTEKATILSEQNKTVFKVLKSADKKTIKKNIEKLFKVNVIKVNIINKKPKVKIRDGVKNLLDNIVNFRDAPVWTPKKIKKATKIWFKLLKNSK